MKNVWTNDENIEETFLQISPETTKNLTQQKDDNLTHSKII